MIDKQQAYQFIADNIRIRPYNNDDEEDGSRNFIHRTTALILVDMIYQESSNKKTDLVTTIRNDQVRAGENAVIENLKRLGF